VCSAASIVCNTTVQERGRQIDYVIRWTLCMGVCFPSLTFCALLRLIRVITVEPTPVCSARFPTDASDMIILARSSMLDIKRKTQFPAKRDCASTRRSNPEREGPWHLRKTKARRTMLFNKTPTARLTKPNSSPTLLHGDCSLAKPAFQASMTLRTECHSKASRN
jgi:hypothetical protein